MAKPKSASRSSALAPIESTWHSIRIRWCGADGAERSYPYPEFEAPKELNRKAFISEVSLKEIDDQGLPRPLPSFSSIRNARKRAPRETLFTGTPYQMERFVAEASTTYVAPQDTSAVLRMKRTSEAVLCTEARQWISVIVTCKADTANCPPMHVWSFLQPAKIGGNRKTLASFSELLPDDHPRSGWGEYMLAEGGQSCVRRTWVDGRLKEELLDRREFHVDRVSSTAWRLRLHLRLRNDTTPGDVARRKSRGGPARPEDDYEAGCWLKAWVRDPKAGWALQPSDDETEDLQTRMDEQDPQRFDTSLGLDATLSAHAFLRGRMLRDGKSGKHRIEDATPIYAMLFTQDAMDKLLELNNHLHPKGKSVTRQTASVLTVSAAVLLIAYGLRRALEEWQKKTGARPANAPADVDWPAWANKEKAEFLMKLLESFDVASLLATYAADGFENMSPIDVAASTGTTSPTLVSMLAAVYGQVFDMALAQGPLHYKEFVTKRIEARQQVLEKRIQWSKEGKARRAAEAEHKAAMAKKLEEFKKQKGLGLFDTSSRAKFRVEKTGFNASFSLAEGSTKKSFPAPAGAPLPIPGIPLVWRLDLSADAGLRLEINIGTSKEGNLELTLGMTGTGNAQATFGIHALWSGLSDPKALAHAPSLEADWKQKTGQASAKETKTDERREYESNKKALREIREGALDESPDPSFKLFRLLKELNQAVRLDLAVTAALKLKAGLKLKIVFEAKTGERKVYFLQGTASPKSQDAAAKDAGFTGKLDFDMSAQLQASLLSIDYPLAKLPEMGSLSASALSANLDGTILGNDFPGVKWQYKWGKGTLLREVIQDGGKTFVIWGRPTPFRLGYRDMEKPDIAFDLRLKASSAGAAIGEIPSKACSYDEQTSHRAALVNLQLTCRKTPSQPHYTLAGSWKLDEDLGKALGQGVGSRATPARTFLEELTSGKGVANVVLHAKDPVPTDAYSEPMRVFCPTVEQQSFALRSDKTLVMNLTLGYFEDDLLWVQLREYNSVLSDSVLLNQGSKWLPIFLAAIKPHPKGRTALLKIPFRQITFPLHKDKVWEVYPVLSLVPDECGIINRKWFPQRSGDYDRAVQIPSGA